LKVNGYFYDLMGLVTSALVAQLGERKTEDLKVRGSIPRGGTFLLYNPKYHILIQIIILHPIHHHHHHTP
jgi:hypothetical protein